MRTPSELERFAIRIERRIKDSGRDASMDRLVCRLLVNNKNPAISAMLAVRWVEWRYGKPKDNNVPAQIINIFAMSDRDKSEALKSLERIQTLESRAEKPLLAEITEEEKK